MSKRYIVLLLSFSFFLFFAGTIDLNSLFNYSNQTIPSYINEDNTPNSNPITDEGATLGRVLFYDKNLSSSNTTSCASCHKQEFAFGDSDIQSTGHDGGLTGRHSPRLSSARFGEEEKFFWDERANTLEEQSTMPIQDHIEMGFSGTNGDPDIDSLISKLEEIYYYEELFNMAFGDQTITEDRIQDALAQFVRSIQSFDSKYDVGRAQVGNNNANFPNFTEEENNGKALYMSNSDTGCNRCHRAPEFDIDPNSRNNGVVGVAGDPGGLDITNERSPSLRDIVNDLGEENGPYMHDGSLATLMDVINHYDDIPNNPNNTNLDNRLNGPGGNLNLTDTEKDELLAFLKTLGGSNIYTDEKWSDPFDEDGNLEILNGVLPIELVLFESHQKDDNVVLKWETIHEKNNLGFEVQHSYDSENWRVLDFIDGEENSKQVNSYEFIDNEVTTGTNYYRLKQVDLDGAFFFSEVLVELIESELARAVVYPNPTYDFVSVSEVEESVQAFFINSEGELAMEIRIDGDEKLDLTNLASGVYILQLRGNKSGFIDSRKFIKL